MNNILESQIEFLEQKKEMLQNESTLLKGWIENTQKMNVEAHGAFIRPASWFSRGEFLFEAKILIDEGLVDGFELTDWHIEDKERTYRYYTTGGEKTSDAEIITFLEVREIQSRNEVLTTAFYLIRQDMDKTGFLHEELEKDRNVNCGYCKIEYDDNIFVVWVERTRTQGEYHIHKEKIPRYYKPYRHMLVR